MLILSTNPNRKTQGFCKNVFDTIRPEKGDRVLNAFDTKHLYSGIDDYLSAGKPATDFFKVLTDNGANLGKMFKNLKEDAPVLENMYKEAGKTGSIRGRRFPYFLQRFRTAYSTTATLPIRSLWDLTSSGYPRAARP